MSSSFPPAVRLATFVLLVVCAATGSALAEPLLTTELRGFLPPDFATAAAPAPALSGMLHLPPMVELRSVLRMAHLVGLCLGLGLAVALDLSMLGWLRKGHVPPGAAEFMRSGERLVAIGLALLWASGLALTVLAVRADPAFVDSPKLWAKVTIVAALTLNAALLHDRILPAFEASLGRRIDGNWRGRERRVFLLGGSVSAASWTMAFALGILKEWNYAAKFGVILALWLLAIAIVLAALRFLFPRPTAHRSYEGVDRRAAALERIDQAGGTGVPLTRASTRLATS
ncbi:hypothetical protein ASG43_06155 [Aureimonas sp. Leaf454]|uniref:hypothetical protein n=1 Tax=Aureimonas sp. Leaf454 TaxID=1736381 RepID=UPI0006F5E276|nr:hypothetical protein [Aureimonas sp. Leaf454]KQT50842.1 hypothetical protein ASG43_06155 [Aureimonas sp. Leaf454]